MVEDITLPKYQRQIELEEAARALAYEKGETILRDAMDSGRYAELPQGRRLVAAAYEVAVVDLGNELDLRVGGVGAKYRTMLKRIPLDTVVCLGLRYMLSCCTARNHSQSRLQNMMQELGKALEAEAMVQAVEKAAPVYLERTLQYLDRGFTKSINHRYRTFLAAAETTIRDWPQWEPQERTGTAKLLMSVLFNTGLFEWKDESDRGRTMKHLAPSAVLADHLADIQQHVHPIVRHDPMIVPPEPWTGIGAGGYLTPWMRAHSQMISMKHLRGSEKDWVLENLKPDCTAVKAMNKAQETPYRVNKAALSVLQQALAVEAGAMGLPAHGQAERPKFPFPDTWEKDKASAEEIETFQQWKRRVAEWHAIAARKAQTKRSLALGAQTLSHYQDEPELFFVSYLDYRGRVYFRGAVHPQSHDAVKACLEFANSERLGERGLFWLKVHVASCAGYDKVDFPLRALWTEQNWGSISAWVEAPLDAPAPEPDTAMTFYAAAKALKEALALPDPTQYQCRIPVAMDATCSGLQHFSAMFRDPLGAEYTNLKDSGGTEKRDIYTRVADVAQRAVRFPDEATKQFWAGRKISRAQAKRPVMTFCYGSTLKSCIDYVADGLADEGAVPITDEDGKVLYSLHKLAVEPAKALRRGVISTVPAAAAAMEYFQKLARVSPNPLRWITPVGMPVFNYVEGELEKRAPIRSMGITSILLRQRDGKYNRKKAVSAIAPNVVHSMDGSHLCLVLCAAPFDIVPIHDSFASHPSNVDAMHRVLREQFVDLYQNDLVKQFEDVLLDEKAERPARPATGTFDIREILSSRFVFC